MALIQCNRYWIDKRLCGNAIASNEIHIFLVHSSEINAFALPGNNLVVYTGLLNYCDSVQELSGVIAHEIGHIKLHHVMKRLAGEIGIATLVSMTSNGRVASQAIKVLSSSAFERKQESEADDYAISCLKRANINPEGFAGFMEKMAEVQKDVPEELEWISSHPESIKRAETIRALSGKPSQNYEPVINAEEWAILKKAAIQN